MTGFGVDVDPASALRRDSRVRDQPQPHPRRRDIDGLRALAIALVVVYHVWFGRVSGGVDVFLLVSAFLLTGSFLRRAEEVGFPFVFRFWLGRFARLLSASAVTIAGVLAFTFLFRPSSGWREVWNQSWASLSYIQNWELAAGAVDYYARTAAFPSPLQHFWSLSVQGQVFLLWPVIIAVSLWAARIGKRDPGRTLTAVFAGIFVVSFVWSVVATSINQQVAYFDTGARLWEFALGSLTALVAPKLRLPAGVVVALAWAGLAGLVLCGIVLDVSAAFPGWAALWPTLCAVALLIAGSAGASGPTRFLASRPLAALGRIAYSLYLVHWPVLIGVMVLTDSTAIGPFKGVVVIVVSVVLAGLLHRYVERWTDRRATSSRRRVMAIVAAVLVVAVPLAGWQVVERLSTRFATPDQNPGAAVLLPAHGAIADSDAPVLPTGAGLGDEWVHLDQPCSGQYRPDQRLARAHCSERRSGTDAERVALVIGDSHAEQVMAALRPITDEAGWDLVAVLKGGCGFGQAYSSDENDECRDWQEDAVDYATELRPHLIVLMGSRAQTDGAERMPENLPAYVESFTAAGSEVLLLRDNPRFTFNMFECAEEFGAGASECRVESNDSLAPEYAALSLAEADAVYAVDLTPYVCPEGVCVPVIGNVAVYLDDNHLTGTYAATLAPALRLSLSDLPSFPLP